MISQGTHICCWRCSHPEYLPSQGTREYQWGCISPPWCSTLGTKYAIWKQEAQEALFGSCCWLLRVVARSQLSRSLPCPLNISEFLLCSWLWLWEGQGLPVQCSRNWCLDRCCYQNLKQVLGKSPVFASNTMIWDQPGVYRDAGMKALAGQTRGFSWLFRDWAQLPFLLSHHVMWDVSVSC